MGILDDGNILEENVDDAREVLIESIPISTYLIDNGFDVEPGDGKMLCPNPMHDDSNPSCLYSDENGTINCFGCNLKGSVVELNLTMQRANDDSYSQIKSIMDLARDYSVTIPNLFKYNKKRNAVVKKVSKDKDEGYKYEQVYKAKINKFEDTVNMARFKNQISYDEALKYYKIIDEMWEDILTPKEAYEQLEILSNK